MIKHTIEVSRLPAQISLKHKQLVLQLEEGETRRFACEDVGVLILQHPAISLSAAVLNELLQSGAVVIICGANRLPTGILLPTVTHTELVPRMMAQLESEKPARKNAWKLIVQAKIKNQAADLPDTAKRKLLRLAANVKSGDTENHEAQAAKIYWPARFPERYAQKDKRDPDSESLFNSCLNYGYAIVRAAVARALVSAGLQPALGVFHHHRSNPFCLADDVMEPLRPLVDLYVEEILNDSELVEFEPLSAAHRQKLLGILTHPVKFADTSGPLMAVLPRYVNSFYRVLTKETKTLTFPSYAHPANIHD